MTDGQGRPEGGRPDGLRIVTVGPDGAPIEDLGQLQGEADEQEDDGSALTDMVEQPAKVMRIGTMIKQLLEEVRAAPLDEASRASPRSCVKSWSGSRCRSPRTRSPATPSCASRRRSWWVGSRGCSTGYKLHCSHSRWPPARSWRRCGAARCRSGRRRAASSRTGRTCER